ncbi:MAG TPA: STAS domain-containing protein [Coxiellaceae bacterium]|nr:STAS domain-containing protein [Coxiellaceae bacterium]
MKSASVSVFDQHIAVAGNICFDTVLALRQEGDAIIDTEENKLVFNFKGVHSVDSSALTLLAVWTRRAKMRGKLIQFTHLPSSLMAMIKAFNLTSILPLSANGDFDQTES